MPCVLAGTGSHKHDPSLNGTQTLTNCKSKSKLLQSHAGGRQSYTKQLIFTAKCTHQNRIQLSLRETFAAPTAQVCLLTAVILQPKYRNPVTMNTQTGARYDNNLDKALAVTNINMCKIKVRIQTSRLLLVTQSKAMHANFLCGKKIKIKNRRP